MTPYQCRDGITRLIVARGTLTLTKKLRQDGLDAVYLNHRKQIAVIEADVPRAVEILKLWGAL